MISRTSFVIVDSNGTARNDAMAKLKSLGGHVEILAATASLQEAVKCMKPTCPPIVILEVKDIDQGVKETSFIMSRFPRTTIIAAATDKNPDWILRLIRAGAGEYFTKPLVAEEFFEAVKRAIQAHSRMNGIVSRKGTTIAVYNPTGGMGTTTIAVNLAATLAGRGKQVALIDLNLHSGDITAFLDLSPRYTLTSIMAKKGQIDASYLKSIIVPHSSGVHVLNSPLDLTEAHRVQPELLQEVIGVLQTLFEYTVIDTGGQLFGCNLATFECSDKILFTTLLNLPALKNAKRYLSAMDDEGIGDDKVKLVVNRHIPKDDIKVSDAEKVLGTRVCLTVPNAYTEVKTSINKGVPLVVCYPRSPVTKAMDDLANGFAATAA